MKAAFLPMLLLVASSVFGLANRIDVVPSVEVGAPSMATGIISMYIFPFSSSSHDSFWKIDKSGFTFGLSLSQGFGFDLTNLPGFVGTSLVGLVLDDPSGDDFRARAEVRVGRLFKSDWKAIGSSSYYGGVLEGHLWFLYTKVGLFKDFQTGDSAYIPFLSIGMKFWEPYH